MSLIALWIGVLIFGLVAIFSLLSAVRTLQTSRRWSDYRLRRRYVVQARGSVLVSLLAGALAIGLLVFGRSLQHTATPVAPPPTLIPLPSETAVPSEVPPPTDTAAAPPVTDTPTAILNTATPTSPPIAAATATPAMPIAVQAMVQGTATPSFQVQFGRLRFSTEVENYTLISPGERFQNPIRQMYTVFTYQPVGVKVQWTALWYQNGDLKYVDTTSWQDFPPGVAVAKWLRPAPEWEAGTYEVQVFVGTEWKTSGRFNLEGEPPTETASPTPTMTSSPTTTPSATATPSITPTTTETPLPPPTRTEPPTLTPTVSRTPAPTSSPTARPTSSSTPTVAPTATVTPLPTSTPQPTRTPLPSSTPQPTPTPLPSSTPQPTLTPLPTSTPTYTRVPTRTPLPTATNSPRPTPSFTASPLPTSTPPPTATYTPRPTSTPVPSSTPTRTPTRTPSPTSSPTTTPTPAPVSIKVYFLSARPSAGQSQSAVEAVTRVVPGSSSPIAAAVEAYFAGPTAEEQSRGLVPLRNGFVGYRRLNLTAGVLSVYLAGNCTPTGNGSSLAQPLIATLKELPGVQHVKIYDAYDHTGDVLGPADAWPVCLDVIFTSTPTASPTRTPTPRPSSTPTASPVPTRTPLPTATSTPLPTRTPLPTSTFTPRPTATALPSLTPSITRTPTSTGTPTVTFTASPTLTLTPINAPTRATTTTLQPSPTTRPGLPTPTLDAACNRAEFLGDVTVADNATLRPGEIFRKTWRIQNAGNCSWTPAYKLVFVGGEHMGGPDTISLPGLTAPGRSVDLSVDLVAPLSAGEYQGYWQLQTPGGTTFGIGPTASGNLWVKIHVAGAPVPSASIIPPTALSITPTGWAEVTLTSFVATETAQAAMTATAARLSVTLVPEVDFAETACQAQWQANDGILPCPGSDGAATGAVIVLSDAAMEDGTTLSAPTLLTIPSASQDGYILGLYPAYDVKAGDHFQARVGCQNGAPQCSVLFRVSYLDTDGAAHDLWTLGEFYDGHHFDLDLDLGALAGQQIRLVLSVNNLGASLDDRALWIAPRIAREPVSGETPTPTATGVVEPTTTVTPPPSPLPPTPTALIASPTPVAPSAAPSGPIAQFFNSIIEFFRRLFGGH